MRVAPGVGRLYRKAANGGWTIIKVARPNFVLLPAASRPPFVHLVPLSQAVLVSGRRIK
jgi:hypothetical protein